MRLLGVDTTSTHLTMFNKWSLEAQPAKGVGTWSLSDRKSSPTPRSPRTTLLNTLA